MRRFTRSVVFAYSEIGCVCLEALLSMGAEVCALFTHEDDPDEEIWFRSAAAIAREAGIPVFTDPPGRRAEHLRALAPDLIFSFYYRKLIPDELLALAPGGAYNLHGSLLPRYRGRAPVNWAIIMGERESGVTLHQMTAEADRGDIVDQEPVPIGFHDTARGLYAKMTEAARAVMLRSYPLIAAAAAPRRPQDESLASSFGRRRPSDGLIDWSRSAEEIHNLVRGTTHPFPGAFSYLPINGAPQKIYIWKARPILAHGPMDGPTAVGPCEWGSRGPRPLAGVGGAHGLISSLSPLLVATPRGALQIERIQLEGAPERDAAAFVSEHGITQGMIFTGGERND